ncbi:MAG: hypothetical protein ACRDQ7_10145 [Haloechinothrix sp.]
MVSPTSRVRSTLILAALACAATLAFGATAQATWDAPKEDPRATIIDGNVNNCGEGKMGADAGGEKIPLEDITFTGGTENVDKYLTIESVDGHSVTGIVVKGGQDTNLYVPGERGLPEEAPWVKLRSPLNGGGQIPEISHWFACGIETTPTSPTKPTGTTTTEPGTTTTTSEPTEPSETTEPSKPGEQTESETPEVTTTSRAAGGATTTESAPVAATIENTGGSGLLADTGFSGEPLIWAGALLILVGGGALAYARTRRTS